MNTKKTWLELKSVEAWLGAKQVFRDLSLSMKLGENTVVLGPNGAGKSSLVQLISRNLYPVVKPGSCLRLFGSENINLWKLRSRLGFLSTDLENRTAGRIQARDLVLSGLFGAIGLGRDQNPSIKQQQDVDTLMQIMDLSELAEHVFAELSDGQRRRVLIARALVHRPEVLVLDEPARALDLKAAHQLQKSLRQLAQQGTTLLQVTHRVDTIIPEMERVVFLKDGVVVGDSGPDQQLKSQPLTELFETPLEVVNSNGYRQVLPAAE
ncbi:MAG: ABC transporter ATP-binding protein [Prochlorococcus sp.]